MKQKFIQFTESTSYSFIDSATIFEPGTLKLNFKVINTYILLILKNIISSGDGLAI